MLPRKISLPAAVDVIISVVDGGWTSTMCGGFFERSHLRKRAKASFPGMSLILEEEENNRVSTSCSTVGVTLIEH